LRQSGADVCLTVADTGVGISKEFLRRAFDRFRQEQSGVTRPHGGLGLGLAIVRHLTELHGGTVGAESDGHGCGAMFTVMLPVSRGAAHNAAAMMAESTQPALAGVRVLVVDDDKNLRQMVSVALGVYGAEVTCASSAAEARNALIVQTPDVMLVDIAMPGEDGYALVHQLRQRGFRQPIAALTAQARAEDRARALMLGCNIHISKPVEAHTLVRTVRDLAVGVKS
jgi:CheY-like chemotaxis protein